MQNFVLLFSISRMMTYFQSFVFLIVRQLLDKTPFRCNESAFDEILQACQSQQSGVLFPFLQKDVYPVLTSESFQAFSMD